MKKVKFLQAMLAFMTAAAMMLSFTACGDDKDDKGDDESSSKSASVDDGDYIGYEDYDGGDDGDDDNDGGDELPETGYFTIVEISQGDQIVSGTDLNPYGLSVASLFYLSRDKVTLMMQGSDTLENGKFIGSGSDLKLVFDNEAADATYKNGRITLDFQGIKMVFEKNESQENENEEN